jgi:L-threonylcarbamoyladenylate synthase
VRFTRGSTPISCEKQNHDHCDSAIRQGAERIRRGGVVAFPTETVYGLGANALDAEAVARIFAIKNRPKFDPLIVHVAEQDTVHALATEVPAAIIALTDRFWPGPLTVVLPKHGCVPDIVTAGLPTVGIRMPAHPMALDLIRQAEVPIAAPSANLFGCISPTCAAHVRDQLGDRVELILDGGSCQVGVESTIVTYDRGSVVLLRPGGISLEALTEIAGEVRVAHPHDKCPQSPGRLQRHYAPHTPLTLREQAGPPEKPGRTGLLALQPSAWDDQYTVTEILSPEGSLPEAATRLFAALRHLDGAGLDRIEAVPVPEQGLGRAINDRLRRAAQGMEESDQNTIL